MFRASIPIVVIPFIFSIACTDQVLNNAIQSYENNRDYGSLQIIYKKLSSGSSRAEVDMLLGEPDYSAIEGQYYYLSNHKIPLEQKNGRDRTVSVGLILDFRDANGVELNTIQRLSIGAIGE